METLIENLKKKFGEANFNKIQGMRVGLAGAGGLGSNCALNLVRSGFKKFTIIDFDVITPANLDRQFYFVDQVGLAKVEALKVNLKRINPDLEINALQEKITRGNIKDLFKGCSIIVECFDKAEYKSLLVQEFLGKADFIVGVSGLGGVGSSDEIRIHRLKPGLVIVGDLESDISHKPPFAPRVSIAAAKQADVILEYVLESGIIK